MADSIHTPQQYQGVMVSSTFTDLVEHRKVLMEALRKEELFAIGMEEYKPVPGDDVISSSLNMVRKGSAYVGLVSHKCGQVLEDSERNPLSYSVTRLEFEEAQHIGLPTLVFIMGDKHPGTKADFEADPAKIDKLIVFRKRVQEGRIYVNFNSLEEFSREAVHAAATLRQYLAERVRSVPTSVVEVSAGSQSNPISKPPDFYAEPPYIGSHDFIGRHAQLDTLNDWATPADPHPLLLFEAIGGTGKSMLTWHWINKQATERADWAGRFWYSFYEGGATMAVFCQRALAYMTGRPFEELRTKKTTELAPLLLAELRSRPWLLVLDGLERVLVSYHRFDAAQVADEDAGMKDQIAQRDPCAAVRPEDDDLLRQLAAASPSKILLTTRLTPRVLLNQSSQGIPGVLRVPLPGLRPADAEKLFRSCNIRGGSVAIQAYLKSQCDCHPLVIGVLAGLIRNYLPDRSNFDAWVADPDGGGKLNLAELDLNQKRNHILRAALEALPSDRRQLLSTLALLPESVDYPTLSALNPYLPAEPVEIYEPTSPEEELGWNWSHLSVDEQQGLQAEYEEACKRYANYEEAMAGWRQEVKSYPIRQRLTAIVDDLDRRGLLQYDSNVRRYDLHPVVRGIAVGDLQLEEKKQYGQRVVDYFSRQTHPPYEEAETLADVSAGLHVVRTLLQMGQFQEAFDVYVDSLSSALLINLEASAEVLALISSFFPNGWSILPDTVIEWCGAYLANAAGSALTRIGEFEAALGAFAAAFSVHLSTDSGVNIQANLTNAANCLNQQNRLAKVSYCLELGMRLGGFGTKGELFRARFDYFNLLISLGKMDEAEVMWKLLDPMGRQWPRYLYRPGDAESTYAIFLFRQGKLDDMQLAQAEQLARGGKNRAAIRSLLGLRGEWRLKQGQWALAAESLSNAVQMARAIGRPDIVAETRLVLAKFHLGQLTDPRYEAEQLAQAKQPAHLPLARLWLAVGESDLAQRHALLAYEAAWADGEPYVYRYSLDQARALLDQLKVDIPILSPYNPTKDRKLPWENDVEAAIGRLRVERAEEPIEEI